VPIPTNWSLPRQRANPIETVTDDVVAQVAGWRRLRMSWAAIGRNLGLTADAAKRRFERTSPAHP